MNNQPPLSLSSAVFGATLTFLYTARWYGLRYATRSALMVLLTGTVAEYVAIRRGLLRHHATPKVAGLPAPIWLAWYITVQHLAILSRAATDRSLALPFIAVSYDAMTDPYGLANGWWEWDINGFYAQSIEGPNGNYGVPITNFVGWSLITTLVERLAPVPQVPTKGSVIISNLIITPAYIAAFIWMLRRRKYTIITASAGYPLAVLLGLFASRRK